MVRLVVVKLGGSLITNKDRPYSINLPSALGTIERVKRSGVRAFLVHGGGSFGHYQAFRHGLGGKPVKGSRGVPETKAAMLELNLWILYFMISSGLRPFPVPPQFLDWELIDRIAASGLTPVSYGDVYFDGHVTRIISGDEIVEDAAKHLDVERVVFALSVPGVLRDPNDPDTVIPELKKRPEFSGPSGIDVTGGMKEKVETAFRIAGMGVDVAFVKGDTDEFIKALHGLPFRGTIVRGI